MLLGSVFVYGVCLLEPVDASTLRRITGAFRCFPPVIEASLIVHVPRIFVTALIAGAIGRAVRVSWCTDKLIPLIQQAEIYEAAGAVIRTCRHGDGPA